MGKGAGTCNSRPALHFGGATATADAVSTEANLSAVVDHLLREGDTWATTSLDDLATDWEVAVDDLEPYLDLRVAEGLLNKVINYRDGVSVPLYQPNRRAKTMIAHHQWNAYSGNVQAILHWVAEQPRPVQVTRIAQACALDMAQATSLCAQLLETGDLEKRQRRGIRGLVVRYEIKSLLKTIETEPTPLFDTIPLPPAWQPPTPVAQPAFDEHVWRTIRTTWGIDADDLDHKAMGLTQAQLESALEAEVQAGRLSQRGSIYYSRGKKGITERVSLRYVPTSAGLDHAVRQQLDDLDPLLQAALYQYVIAGKGHQYQAKELQAAIGVSLKEASSAIHQLRARYIIHKTVKHTANGSTRTGWELSQWGKHFYTVMQS
jgi:hypothetical protein